MADFSFVDGNAPSATTWNSNVRDQLFVICTSSTRPSAPTTGRHIWETDTLKGYYYSGSTWTLIEDSTLFSAWTSFSPTWTASGTQPAIGNGTLTAKYRLVGKTLDVRIILTMGSTTTFGTGYWYFTMPASQTAAVYTPAASHGIADDAGVRWPVVTIASSGNLFPYCPTGSGDIRLTTLGTTVPFTWANGDILYMNVADLEVA